MLKEFKQFILRGNVVDLAVAFVVGAAFTAVVTSLVENLITPLIAAIGGQPDFSRLTFEVNNSVFRYGDFINALVAFVLLSAVIFFVVVKPINQLQARVNRSKTTPEPTEKKCPQCLSSIPKAAKRCAFCTAKQQ